MRPVSAAFAATWTLLCLAGFGLLAAAPAAAQQPRSRIYEVPQTQRERDAERGYVTAPEAAAGAPSGSRSAMLQDLAGTLGAVHYFTVACDGRGDQYWRERMIALLEAEAPGDQRLRAAMVQTFNDQYRERERAFPQCSPEARNARGLAAQRGLELSEALAEPYR